MRSIMRTPPSWFAMLSALALSTSLLAQTPAKTPAAPPPGPAAPVVTVETVKGTIVFETYPLDAPKSVEHIVALVKRRFYDGTAIHRVVAGQLAQWGDQQSRNAQLKEWWGRGAGSGSGSPIGVAEISKKRRHKLGTVSLAHPGTPASADSQMFFALRASPQWDGKYTIIGQVTSGLEILPKLQVGDRIKKVTVSSTP
jgi:cyclophilin family peptidyl-prolyl cis-trans isomerase